MSTLNDNRLHADPEIQGTAPHADRSSPFERPKLLRLPGLRKIEPEPGS